MQQLLAILLITLSLPGTSQELTSSSPSFSFDAGQAEVEFLPVEEAYRLALEVVDERQVRLYWQIAEDYYLYRQRFAFQLSDADGDVSFATTMNDGIEHEDEYFGITEVYYHFADINLALNRAAGPATLKVTSQGCADAGLCYPPQKQHFRIDFANRTITAASPPARTAAGADTPGSTELASEQTNSGITLLYMMLLAFGGGCILNLMPCVFPVLSLKVLSFATGSEHDKHVHGWIYSAGVVFSFLLVAGLLLALQQAGSAVGWGFQLQSPTFVSLLAYLFFVMGLSLSGLLELGANLMGVGSNLANRGGYPGSFFTGVLATIVASPCTAPFMGTALGFAATQTPLVALTVFGALGAGMAAPMLLLSYSKTLRASMPKPGPWMETFKQMLAFPLYATAIWLLWVAGRQTGVNGMAVLLCGMLALTLGLMLWRYGNWARLLAAGLVVAAVAITGSPLLETRPATANTDSQDTQQFSEARLSQLLAAGKPVFINVTADWCITCLANERAALATTTVQQALAEKQVTYLKADWTNYDPTIADFIARFNRNGIPLYLVYSGRAGEAPQILPQLLTTGIVLEALRDI
jgi:thiol:disulfide interchange protein